MALLIVLSPEDINTLYQIARETGRSPEDLAESAVSEEILRWRRTQPTEKRGSPLPLD